MAALAGGDAQAAVDAVERAARRAPPNHPYLLYAKVRAYTKAGRADEAFAALGLLAEKGIAADVLVSPAFETLRDHGRWPEWQEKLQALVAPAQHSVVAFRLNEPDFFPDAMTYDRGSRRFLIGSLFKRKVVVVDEVTRPRRRLRDVARGRVPRRPRTRGGQPAWRVVRAQRGRSGDAGLCGGRRGAVVPAPSAALVRTTGDEDTAPPPLAAGHLLDALVQAADGTLYMTDARAGVLYRWRPGARAIEPFVTIGADLRPSGLAWSADGRALYVSHLEGISRVTLATREVVPVGHPASVTLVGIDGLATYQGDLIAVQNGLPGLSRVVRLRLAQDGVNVRAVDILDANLPDHDMPTSGVVVGDGYYYIANSQLRRFTAPGVPGPADALQKPVIRRVNLVTEAEQPREDSLPRGDHVTTRLLGAALARDGAARRPPVRRRSASRRT